MTGEKIEECSSDSSKGWSANNSFLSKMTCECSICYDTISAETGQVTLACSHVYHLGCVSRWFTTNQSCPLCRKEPTEKERLPAPAAFEEDDEASEYDDDTEDEEDRQSLHLEIPPFNADAAAERAQDEALWVMRTTFERLEEDTLPTPAPLPKKMDLSWGVYLIRKIDGASYTTALEVVEYESDTEYNRRIRYTKERCHTRTIEHARGGYESA